MRQTGEPTIEEILESIKRVIAREDRGARLARTRAEPREPEDCGPDEGADHDVLDLALHDRIAEDTAPLVAEGASSGVRGSLDALAAAATHAPASASTASPEGSVLEPLVRELLRPALSDWLDRNLPAIVERLVAAEIARITRARG